MFIQILVVDGRVMCNNEKIIVETKFDNRRMGFDALSLYPSALGIKLQM